MKWSRAVVTALLLAVPALAVAQHGSHGGHSGGGSSGGFGHMGHDGNMKDFHKQLALQATPEQQARYASSGAVAEKVQNSLLEFAAGADSALPAADLRDKAARLQDSFSALDESHNAFAQGLTKEQTKAVKGPLSKLDKAGKQFREQLREVEKELGGASPDPRRVKRAAEKMGKTVQEWRKQYRQIGTAIGTES